MVAPTMKMTLLPWQKAVVGVALGEIYGVKAKKKTDIKKNSMKRNYIFSCCAKFFALWLLLANSSAVMAGVVHVSSANELKNAVENNASADIYITADIDLSQLGSSSDPLFDVTFKGSITGTKSTDSTGKTNACYKLKNGKNILFEKLDHATFTDLVVTDCTFDPHDTMSGIMAFEANETTFSSCMFCNITSKDESWLYEYDCAGTVVGIATGCTFKDVCVLACTIGIDGAEAGGIVGRAKKCSFTNCMVNALTAIYADGNLTSGNGAFVGGLVGMSTDCHFDHCTNYASVGANDDNVGGITGKDTGSVFGYCTNCGMVAQMDESIFWRVANCVAVGISAATTTAIGINLGYIGYLVYAKTVAENLVVVIETQYAIAAAEAFASIFVPAMCVAIAVSVGYLIYSENDPDEVGGIAGYIAGSRLYRCANYASVECMDAYAGGIVGYATSNGDTPFYISDCLNQGRVSGNEQTGGIVGYAKNGTVNACLQMGTLDVEKDTWGNIVGDTGSNVTSAYCCYLASEDDSESLNIASITRVSSQSLASGAVTFFLNQHTTIPLESDMLPQDEVYSDAPWRQTVGTDFYPTLDETNGLVDVDDVDDNANIVHRVSTGYELFSAACNPYAEIELACDISMSNDQTILCMGSEIMPFQGTIDGKGYSISGIYYKSDISDKEKLSKVRNIGLFSWAKDATFRNLTLDGVDITACENVGSLVGHSNNCSYTNVKVLEHSNLYVYGYNGGLLVGNSTKDYFLYCSTTPGGKVYGDSDSDYAAFSDAQVGGLVGIAKESTLEACVNRAWVDADDDYAGGLVGYDDGGTALRWCVNVGDVTGHDSYLDDLCGGLVGYLSATGSITGSLSYCTVNAVDQQYVGKNKGGNIYQCLYNYAPKEGNGGYSTNASAEELSNGFTAMYLSELTHFDWYQNIDNGRINTGYPSPIPTDGDKVSSNVLCDGTLTYSNYFRSAGAHEHVGNALGQCEACGDLCEGGSDIVYIENAEQLMLFAYAVNNGAENMDAVLQNDIDLSGLTWVPIGSAEHPYAGSFDGQGHTLSNLVYNNNDDRYHGLFGYVQPGVQITDLILDSSCSFRAQKGVVAAFVGGAKSSNNGTITLSRLLNNANVTGNGLNQINTAAIMGGVYDNDGQHVVMSDCGNTGAIIGSKQSASLCGYARKEALLTRCWNTGVVVGNDEQKPFVRFNSATLTDCYQLATLPQQTDDAVTPISADDIAFGLLCDALNDGRATNVWSQDIPSEAAPTLGTTGVHHNRKVSSKWGTVCLPFSIASNDDIQLYTISAFNSREGVLTVEEVQTVDAEKPALFAYRGSDGKADFVQTAPCVENRSKSPTVVFDGGIGLFGVYSDTKIDEDVIAYNKQYDMVFYYIAQNKFWLANKSFSIPAFRAYIAYNTEFDDIEYAPTLRLSEDVTGIEKTVAEEMLNPGSKFFDGIRVVIVRDGKKYDLSGKPL